jgi:hypothetical protein
MLPGLLRCLGYIGVFDRAICTYPHAFLAAGAGVRVADMHMRTPGAVHFYKNGFRADCHALPAALTLVWGKPNVFRFTQKKKMEYIHNLN